MNKADTELQRKILLAKRKLIQLSKQKEQLSIQANRYRETNKIEFFEPLEHQQLVIDRINDGKKVILLQGGNRIGKCLTSNTLIETPDGEVSIGELYRIGKPFKVYAWDGKQKVVANASVPFKKSGLHECYRLNMSDGRFIEAADNHRILMQNGRWAFVDELMNVVCISLFPHQCKSGSYLFQPSSLSYVPIFDGHQESNSGISPLNHVLNARSSLKTIAGYQDYYLAGYHQCDALPRAFQGSDQVSFPLQDDVQQQSERLSCLGGLVHRYNDSDLQFEYLPSNQDVRCLNGGRCVESLYSETCRHYTKPFQRYQELAEPSRAATSDFLQVHESEALISDTDSEPVLFDACQLAYIPPLSTDGNNIISYNVIGLQEVYDFEVEQYHNYCAGGLVHHNSVVGAVITGAFGLGYYPWIEGKPETPFGKRPLKMRVLCSDWEHHAGQVIIPKLKEWLPVNAYETKKNNVGIDAFWTFKNTGSTIELMTHVQDTKIHEGWGGHFIWIDEPPPRDKYIANRRGLIDYGGIMLLTLTAVSESWILDDIVLNTDPLISCITEIPITANPHLSSESIESFSKSLTEDEKVARLQGGWLNLVGRVLKEFNADTHIIEPFIIPTDYPVVAMIDLHLSTPQAIGFYTVDKQGRVFVIDEVWENLSPDELADEIIRRKKQNTWRLETAFIDPLAKGDNQFMKNRADVQDSFSIIADKLRTHGIIIDVASKDKDSGVRNLKSMLVGANKMPSLFFFNTCKRHLWEIQRWTYDENGKPKKENDHFMENLYRFTLTGTTYTNPEIWDKKIKFDTAGIV